MQNDVVDFNSIEFTFYGDLLGTANLYKIDKDLAYRKLDFFYNAVWEQFNQLAREFPAVDLNIILFSDSIFITGRKLKIAIENLAELYYALFVRQIFIRGALVAGRLDFDPRLELRNLTKNLPKGDTLFRAITLEKYVKGARLLIENSIAKQLLPREWLTDELYSLNADKNNLPVDDFRRRIVLHREWRSYEYLWTWPSNPRIQRPIGWSDPVELINEPDSALTRLSARVPKIVGRHYEETRELFEIAAHRVKITNAALGLRRALRRRET